MGKGRACFLYGHAPCASIGAQRANQTCIHPYTTT